MQEMKEACFNEKICGITSQLAEEKSYKSPRNGEPGLNGYVNGLIRSDMGLTDEKWKNTANKAKNKGVFS